MATLALISKPAIADAIVAKVREGVPVGTACRLAGVDKAQLTQWRAIMQGAEYWPQNTAGRVSEAARSQIVSLFNRIADAEAAFQASLINIIAACAAAPNPKTGAPGDWRAGDVLLSKHPAYRHDWYEHRETTVEHTGSVAVQVAHRVARGMSDDDLIAARNTPPLPLLETPGVTEPFE